MLSAGVATQADVLRNEVQALNADVGLTQAKNAFELAKDAFNNALGRDLETEIDLTELEFSGKVDRLPDYREVMQLSLQYRPDWKEYQLSKEIGEETLKVSYTGYLPTVMAQGQVADRIVEYPTSSLNTDTRSWSITGMASWTLFDGLGLQNRIREAAANLDAQKANEEQVRNGIALEVRDARLNLKSALETIDSSEKAVESAVENYKVSRRRFASGAGTNLEVLDAQVQLTQARTNYLQALFNIEIAKAKLNKVVGWEIVK
jgi:outer membrane protein